MEDVEDGGGGTATAGGGDGGDGNGDGRQIRQILARLWSGEAMFRPLQCNAPS